MATLMSLDPLVEDLRIRVQNRCAEQEQYGLAFQVIVLKKVLFSFVPQVEQQNSMKMLGQEWGQCMRI